MGRRDLQDRRAAFDSEVAGYEEKVAETREALRLSGVAREQAEAEKQKDPGDARRFAEAAEKARRHADEEERLTLLAGRYEAELEARRGRLAAAEFELAAEQARAKHAAAEKAAATLAGHLDATEKAVSAFVKARDAEQAAYERAAAVCPPDIELERPDPPAWLPDEWKTLAELAEVEAKRLARKRQAESGAEQSRREAERREQEKLVREYAWTGDEETLAKITVEHLREEARRQHSGIRRRARRQVDPLLEDLRERRTSPSRALSDLRVLAQVPADLAAEAEREIQAHAAGTGRQAAAV